LQNENIKTTSMQIGEVHSSPKAAQSNLAVSKEANAKSKAPSKSKYYRPRYPKSKDGTAKNPMVAPKKIKLLFTVVNRHKTEFFVDVLQNFEVNMQLILSAQGTANDDIRSLLGLTDSDKSVIISVIRQDRIKDALAALEDKFNTVKNGKGIAYTVPIKSAIGVAIYRFLSNTSSGGVMNG